MYSQISPQYGNPVYKSIFRTAYNSTVNGVYAVGLGRKSDYVL